jgi:hypothetical protein
MSAEWHITRQEKQYGPFTEEKLRELAATKRLSPNDLIWRQGMAKWVPAGTVQSLFAHRPVTPPGMNMTVPVMRRTVDVSEVGIPVVNVGATPRKGYRANKKSTRNLLPVAVIVVVVAAIAVTYLMTLPLVSPDGVLGKNQAARLLAEDRKYVLAPRCRAITEDAAEILLAADETLNLGDVKGMSVDVAKVLVKYRGELTVGLSKLTPEMAEVFGGFSGQKIWFSNVRDLTEEAVKALFRGKGAGEFWFPDLDRLHAEAKALDDASDRLQCLGRDDREPSVYGQRAAVARKESPDDQPASQIDYRTINARIKRFRQEAGLDP